MRLDHGSSCAPDAGCVRSSLPPLFGFCRCFLCGHESGIPLPLAKDQRNWIECEWCGLDNEIPAGTVGEPVVAGSVPTRFF
jgi:hypothetical protein